MKTIEMAERTIFDNKCLCCLFKFCSHLFLKLMGWRFRGIIPQQKKLVVIGAPHQSNWDFLIMIAVVFICERKIYWLGKHSLFCFPFKFLFRWLGGIAVEREKSNGSVKQLVKLFADAEELVLVLSPEGTRHKTNRWKKGFYNIAMDAKIPIIFGSVDRRFREARLRNKIFIPTGNIEKDMDQIRKYYGGILGNIPQLASIK